MPYRLPLLGMLLLAVVPVAAISCNPDNHGGDAASKLRDGRAPAAVMTSNKGAAADPAGKVFECRWTDQPIALDGNADKPAWKHAQTIDHFEIPWLTGPARKPHTATKAKLLWDREYLYFLAEMQDTDLFADVREHQGKVWTNDAFELFFKPADDKSGYYEFEVNPANTTLELFFPARDAGGYDRFKSETRIEMKTAVQLRGTLNHPQDKDEGWTVEGRIRWRDLGPTGGRPNVDEAWKFALCRVDYSTGVEKPELSSCAPLSKPSFHQYEDYATLRFLGPDSATAARPYGIDHRVAWTTSHVLGYPDPPLPYTVEKAFANLKIQYPLYVLEEPGTDNLLILQHLAYWNGPGRLLRAKNDPSADHADTVIDMDGLVYGMTLHPDFLHNGFIYFMGRFPVDSKNPHDQILRYTIDRKTGRIDPASKLLILQWESFGHDGGDLAFGPDGYLYHASGDGSSDSDANLRGQDITHLNAAMLRLDVDHPSADKPYSIPPDNPFIHMPGARPEVWAYGFRNPWRIAFDRRNGNLWVGQNGQDAWEQVYLVHRGENYGWSRYEGSHPFNLQRKQGPTPITFPTVEHPHSEMRSLTGGVVYYGAKLPELDGAFIYGDWSTGRIWGVKDDGKKVAWHKEFARTTLQITGFREMSNGDLLVIDEGGYLYRLVTAPKDKPAPAFPRKLSDSGLFASTKGNIPAAGLIPYEVNAPLWSDGALKERFIGLPGDGTIDVTPARGWNFPEGTVLVKTFSLDLEQGNPASARRIETRLFTKQLGQWAGYTYIWNDQQTDAMLLGPAAMERVYEIRDAAAPGGRRMQTWHFPSRTECMTCHTRAANFVLGPSMLQLNRDRDYNGVKDNQLRVLEHLGVLRADYMSFVRDRIHGEQIELGKSEEQANSLIVQLTAAVNQRQPKPSTLLAFDPRDTPHLVNPADAGQPVEARARSYLHANCAICHIEAGGGNSLLSLEFTDAPAKMKIFDVAPQHEQFGIDGARIIAPGRPEASVLYHRLAIRGTGQMPPLASNRIDEQALKLIRGWIEQMKPGTAVARP